MTKLRSRSLVSQFRTLFAGGTLSGLGEGELLERFVGHRDEAAFAELVTRHGPMVLAVCRRWLDDPHDVEDAFQATFLVLVRKAGGLRDRQSVAQWLYGVSHRVARHARASAFRRRERETRTVARRGEPAGPDPADELAGREVLAMVHDELARLPEKQQVAAVLCLVQGLSHEAAARALGWPLGTLKTRIADARATLSRRLARRGVAPSALAAIGGAAFRPPVCSLPPELPRRTIATALEVIAARAMKAGVVGESAAALARNVSRTMLLVRLGTVAIGLAVLGALALAAPALLRERSGPPRSMERAPTRGDEAAPALQKRGPATEPRRDLYGDALPAGAVLRLGTIKYRQDSPICRIAYTPDGKHFVTDGEDSILRVWDAAEGRVIRRIDPGVGAMEDFSLTSRGDLIMTCGLALEPRLGRRFVRRVATVELETGRVADQADWKTDDFTTHLIALCPDRHLIALCPLAGEIRVVDAWTGAEACRLDSRHREVVRIAFARDGKRLAAETRGEAVTSHDRHVVIYDLAQKRELRDFAQPGFGYGDLTFSPDGTTLASVMDDDLFVYRVDTGERIPFRHALVGAVGYSADGRNLAGIGRSGRLGLVDLPARRLAFIFATKAPPPSEVALSPDGTILVANGGPTVLHSWEIKARHDRFAMPSAHTDSVEALLITPDGRTVITNSKDGSIRLWDLQDGRQVQQWHPGDMTQITALSPDGATLAVATVSLDGIRLKTWRIHGALEPFISTIFPKTSDRTWPCAVGFADGGKSVLVMTSQGSLHGWDLVNKRFLELPQPRLSPPALRERADEGPWNNVWKGVFLAGGKKLAVVVSIGGLRMTDVITGRELFHSNDGGGLIVPSPDGRTLAVTQSLDGQKLRRRRQAPNGWMAWEAPSIESESGWIKLVDSDAGQETRRITVQGSKVRALAFSPDGKTLAATTGWETGQIHFLDVASGKETRTIDTPPLRSPALAFTPDGSRLVSAMADGSVLVWDVKPLR